MGSGIVVKRSFYEGSRIDRIGVLLEVVMRVKEVLRMIFFFG